MLRASLHTDTFPTEDNKLCGKKGAPGWVRNKRPECPFSLGLFICTLCVRSGFDLRYHFCPIRGTPGNNQEDLQ